MAPPLPHISLLLSLALPLHVHAVSFPDVHPRFTMALEPNSTLDYLQRTLTGLDLALNFFQREHRSVNLDALIGTRMVEASFTVLLQRLSDDRLLNRVPSDVISSFVRLRDTARDVSDVATVYVIESETEYFQKIGPIIGAGLFELNYPSRDVPADVTIWSYSPREVMKEDGSDDCIAEIFGTRNGVRCDISAACWTQMTTLGYSRYSLSHQIFYLEIAQQAGCAPVMQHHISLHHQGGVARLQDVYCSNMLAEATLIAKAGFPENSQDLFMEQAALCGMLGYRDFFSSDWLDAILSWQDTVDGCYRWAAWNRHGGDQTPIKRGLSRGKREEKRVGRGCLCHRTTVAAAALAQYARYVLEVYLDENQSK